MPPRNFDVVEDDDFELVPDEHSEDVRKEDVKTRPPLEIVWRNVIWLAFLHVTSVYALFAITWRCQMYTLMWSAFLYILGGLGITAGAHRLWAHRTYHAKFPLRLFLAIGQTSAFQNDIYEWCRDHRTHHKFSETDADPHNATRGFFFSHVGWLMVKKHPDVKVKGSTMKVDDLLNDPVVRFQNRHYIPLMLTFCFILPTYIPAFWGESAWNAFMVAGMLRYCLILNATWLVNSAAHIWGMKPYDKQINPSENLMVSTFALGEGWHNYHHTFPMDYRTGEYGWKVNFTTIFIDMMACIGQATNRKVISDAMILARAKRTGDGTRFEEQNLHKDK